MVKPSPPSPKRGRGRPRKEAGVGKTAAPGKTRALPDGPKRPPRPPPEPLTAQELYEKSRIKELRAVNASWSRKHAKALAAAEWSGLKARSETRQQYEEEAREGKQRFSQLYVKYIKRRQKWEDLYGEEWREEHGVEGDMEQDARVKKELRKLRKKEKDPNKPKKPRNPFMFFSQHRTKAIRALEPKVEQKVALQRASVEWKAMSDREKQPYMDMAAEDRVRHTREMEEYTASGGAEKRALAMAAAAAGAAKKKAPRRKMARSFLDADDDDDDDDDDDEDDVAVSHLHHGSVLAGFGQANDYEDEEKRKKRGSRTTQQKF